MQGAIFTCVARLPPAAPTYHLMADLL